MSGCPHNARTWHSTWTHLGERTIKVICDACNAVLAVKTREPAAPLIVDPED